ncbi:MAG TPA: Phenylacetic acid catabolic protein [Paenalcaligenes sp.]|nr:Phenylacetic acid catabolic protein [Paenalcaligenes sp.]
MSSTMDIYEYLAQGGVLTSPDNVPSRYRGELLRLMSSFVDSELAASAGFAASINYAPSIQARIAASRITLEKAEHARKVLAVMSTFGTDSARYEQQHDWAARIGRNESLADSQGQADMRLPVFYYPLQSWVDAVVMNVLQGLAAQVQLAELAQVSYTPFAESIRAIQPGEKEHLEQGIEALKDILHHSEHHAEVQDSFKYWQEKVAAGFSQAHPERYEMLSKFGIRHQTNERMLEQWTDRCTELKKTLNL